MRHIRMGLAHLLLWLVRTLPAGYVNWLAYRWSLLIAPHVTPEERAAAVGWWDRVGAGWGYRRWPDEKAR